MCATTTARGRTARSTSSRPTRPPSLRLEATRRRHRPACIEATSSAASSTSTNSLLLRETEFPHPTRSCAPAEPVAGEHPRVRPDVGAPRRARAPRGRRPRRLWAFRASRLAPYAARHGSVHCPARRRVRAREPARGRPGHRHGALRSRPPTTPAVCGASSFVAAAPPSRSSSAGSSTIGSSHRTSTAIAQSTRAKSSPPR
jgi:hypothetical protein